MAVRKLDLAKRNKMLARISREKREAKQETDKKNSKEERRWKPLVMASTSTSPYLCHCREVKLGFAVVCPAHMLTFQLAQSAH